MKKKKLPPVMVIHPAMPARPATIASGARLVALVGFVSHLKKQNRKLKSSHPQHLVSVKRLQKKEHDVPALRDQKGIAGNMVGRLSLDPAIQKVGLNLKL